MTLIAKKLSGFIFNGSTLNLASAAFKANVNIIYGFNAGGTGYTSFKPSSNFNSLTQLVQDGVYIIDTATTGFDLPGATITAIAATPVAASPLSIDNFLVSNKHSVSGSATRFSFDVTFDLSSSDAKDEYADPIIFSSDPQIRFSDGFGTFGFNGSISVSGQGINGETQKVMAISNNGNIIVKEFVL